MKSRKILTGILAAAALACLGAGFSHLWQENHAGEEYEELREAVKSSAGDALEGASEAALAADDEAEEEPEIPVDFESLQEYNPDIYAWITIPGTQIDYPIVQRPEDNAYYLTHNTDGEESAEGAIFTEDYNSKDFTDPNTILYGHNMKNGSMFRGLHDYMDRSFFDENREVLIYTPDAVLHYEIFAAYLYDSRHLMQSFDFDDPEAFARYLDDIKEIRDMTSFVDTSMEVSADDRIITMSTCYKGMDDRRYLVQAVLVSIET